jgi:hypothetical protein
VEVFRNTPLPLIDRALPQIAQLLVALWIETMSDHKHLFIWFFMDRFQEKGYDLAAMDSVMNITEWVVPLLFTGYGRRGNLLRVSHGNHDQRWAGTL